MFQSGLQDFFQSAWTRTVLYHFEFWYQSAELPALPQACRQRWQRASKKWRGNLQVTFDVALCNYVSLGFVPWPSVQGELRWNWPIRVSWLIFDSQGCRSKLKLDRSALYRTQWGRVVLDEAPRCAEHGAISSVECWCMSIDGEAHRIKARINSTAQATSVTSVTSCEPVNICECCHNCHRKRGVWN